MQNDYKLKMGTKNVKKRSSTEKQLKNHYLKKQRKIEQR